MDSDFTKEILRRVKKIEITTKKLVDDNLAGHYHSAFKGQGMNFSEIREYTSGDDIRNIDWNVTARQGHPYIKKYNEERERTIVLAVDISSSNLFGSIKSKKELIAEISSVISFSAEKNRDKVGLLLFTSKIELYIPPAKGRTHLLRIIRELLFFKPQNNGTNLIKALNFLNLTFEKTITTFLISDYSLNSIPDNFKNKVKTTGRHHDLIAIRIKDINETALPTAGIITLQDLENGDLIEVDTNNKKVRETFNKLIKNRDDNIKKIIQSSGVDFMEIYTGDDYIKKMLKFFITREKRA